MTRSRISLVLAAVGVALAAFPFVYLHFTGDGTLFLIFAPIALVLALAAIVAGLRRPRSPFAIVLGVLLALFSVWMVVGLTLFILTCNDVIDVGSC